MTGKRVNRPQFNIIVVIPIGPGSKVDFVLDTIQSYQHYTRSSYKIILADDSHEGIGKEIQKTIQNCDLLTTKKPMGGWAGLYINLANAFDHALQNYHFEALFKLDTDALVIGKEPERAALDLFRADPYAGMAGQYPRTYNGDPWNIRWPQQRIWNSTRSWKFIRRPVANVLLIKQYHRALKNGYITGESVFGGAYFLSSACLVAMQLKGLLPKMAFRSLNLGEDHLFSLLTKAVGFTLNSLSSGNGPLACSWDGLPAPPGELLQKNKKRSFIRPATGNK